MSDLKLFKIFIFGGIGLSLFLVLFLVLMSNESASGSEEVVVASENELSIPFADSKVFSVTSQYGYRKDPFTSKSSFHSGIDLAVPQGTDVLASASGVVFETGYNSSLGNYVYIEHKTDDGVLYTAYGHMMDNSIVVEKGQSVTQKQKIGQVGSTGNSTGPHLHFTIMKNKISFKEKDLIDPYYVIYGLK